MSNIRGCSACLVLGFAATGLLTTEVTGQTAGLVRMTCSGSLATLDIGPVTPNAFLPMFILPDGIDDPSDLDAALEAGARQVREHRADATGFFQLTYPMDAVPTSLRLAVFSRVAGDITYLGMFVPNPMHESFQAPPVRQQEDG